MIFDQENYFGKTQNILESVFYKRDFVDLFSDDTKEMS